MKLLLLFLTIIAVPVFAQGSGPESVINNINSWLVGIGGSLSIMSLLISGIAIKLHVKNAYDWLKNSVIGSVIVFGAYGISSMIQGWI